MHASSSSRKRNAYVFIFLETSTHTSSSSQKRNAYVFIFLETSTHASLSSRKRLRISLHIPLMISILPISIYFLPLMLSILPVPTSEFAILTLPAMVSILPISISNFYFYLSTCPNFRICNFDFTSHGFPFCQSHFPTFHNLTFQLFTLRLMVHQSQFPIFTLRLMVSHFTNLTFQLFTISLSNFDFTSHAFPFYQSHFSQSHFSIFTLP